MSEAEERRGATPSNPRPADRAEIVSVLAKEPVPGRVKTRLQAEFTPGEAAELAAAALEDTLAAVRGAPAGERVLVWDGAGADWRAWAAGLGFAVQDQRPGPLNARLTGAFADRPDTGAPHLLVGMDTPQLQSEWLAVDWEGADAVLGLSDDGGFWAIGLRASVDPEACFAGIPMSTDRTGAAQLNRLYALGCTVKLLPPLRDVDEPADAEAVAYAHPQLEFAARYRRITENRRVQPADRLFDRTYGGAPLRVDTRSPAAPALGWSAAVAHWSGAADEVDGLVVARCEPPVLDLGCGPGRLVRALTESGRAALGVDISAAAVAASMQHGGLALRARVEDVLPAEGRWGTVLLIDGNVGIGGDVSALLARCADLVVPGGLVLIEVDPHDPRERCDTLVLRTAEVRSPPLPWSRIGATALVEQAAALGLWAAETWSAGGRVFVALRAAA